MTDSQRLWRRVIDHPDHMTYDPTERRWLVRPPPSNALQFDDDGMSMSWREHLSGRHLRGPSAIVDLERNYSLVFEMTAREARELNLAVSHSPQGERPPGCAHSSLKMPAKTAKDVRKEIRSCLAQALQLVHGTPTTEPPPGA